MVMKKTILILLVFLSFQFIEAAQPQLKLRYDFPATNWMTSALPIGNGVFGGMFFGGVTQEQMQFNDKTLWSGSTTVRGAYQSFGDLYINFPTHTSYTDYKRELSLDEAVGRVSYKVGSVSYLREYFASNPDSAIVMRISAPGQSGKLTFTVNLTDAHSGTTSYSANKITMSGTLATISYEAQVKVLNVGGTLTTTGSQISVSNADAVTIILTGATNFNPASLSYVGENTSSLHNHITNRITNTSAKTFDALKTNHLNDYQPLFSRVKLDLAVAAPDVNTDVLIRTYRDNSYLDLLYYQYGRYLMLSSSRGIALPSNLQGLWNNTNSPAWQCDIHSNINVQMNYWPAENTNLSECHLPFTNYIKNEATKLNGSWSKMASNIITTTSNGEKMTGYRGWTIRTQSNIFGYSDWNWNRPTNAWYCMHLWQHFEYTNDTTYLKNDAFPAMKSACEFWFDRLKVDGNGKLVAPDEWSPEQGNWEDNIAYAQQLIWELFDNTLKAAKLIKADATFITTLTDKFSKLDNGIHIGPWGEIKEWTTQPDVQGNTHRHLSPLIALYPGNQISYHKDSASVNAAIVLLNSRGDGGTGWSRAWKISCWARLFDGDHAYKLMKAAQNLSVTTVVEMNDGHGGVYENLFDAHPSFQIDGNFGFTAGVTEMLIQSNQGFIQLLPALPSVWPNGSYSGLKAIGNFTVDVTWKNSLPQQAVVYSTTNDSCKIYYPSIALTSVVDKNGANVPYVRKSNNLIAFATTAGNNYTLVFENSAVTAAVITPYVQVNSNAKVQASSVQALRGVTVLLSPESTSSEGTWSWAGPNSFTASTREVSLSNVAVSNSGNYIVTQTVNGVKTVYTFNVIVQEKFNSQKNVLSAGDYYVKKKDSPLYWTNTNISSTGGTPSFSAKSNLTNNAQVWIVSLDGGYYKIVSKADGRYVNEKGNFGSNAYYVDWNTYNIYSDSIYSAIQITQNSAAQANGTFFWNVNASNAIVYSTNTNIDESKDLAFEFVPVTATALHSVLNPTCSVWTEKNTLSIRCDIQSQVSIYDQIGRVVKQINMTGLKNISLPTGVYIVKVMNNVEQPVIKITVR